MPFEFFQLDVYCSLNAPGEIFSPNGMRMKRRRPWRDVKAVLYRSSSAISTCPFALVASNVKNIVSSPKHVDTLVHAPYLVKISYHHCVQLAVVDEGRNVSVVLKDEDNL